MDDWGRRREQIKIFVLLAAFGVAAELNSVQIPYTGALIDGRWAFGFMGFALLQRWRAALLLACCLSIPLNSHVPLWIGFLGNLLYAVPALLVIRPLSSRLLVRCGPSWVYGLGWLALVLGCYQVFTTPAVWAVVALMDGGPVWPKVWEGWQTQPFLVESILAGLLSAVAMVAVLTHQRLGHIYRMLLGIRSVNQLIVSEDDPVRLIEHACANLTETMGYLGARIVLLDTEGRRVTAAALSGSGGGCNMLREQLARGELPVCMTRALDREGTVVVENPAADCAGCPALKESAGRAGLSRRLASDGKTYGVLSVDVPAAYVRDTEARGLFDEVADDLAFALCRIEMARSHRALEGIYATLYEKSHAVMLVIDSDSGAVVDANPAAERFYGWSREELTRKNIAEINTLTPEQVRAEMQAARDMRRNHFLFKHRRADGSIRDVEVYSGSVEFEERQLLYSIIHDITQRVQAEEALCESERYLRSILQTTADGFLVVDHEGGIIEVNDAYCLLSGYTRDEILGMRLSDLEAAEVPEATADRARRVVVEGSEFFETRHRRKDGSVFSIEVSVSFVRERGGCFVSFCRDLTERKRREEHIALLGQMLDEAPAAVTIHSTEGRFLFANQAACALHGYDDVGAFLAINLHDLDMPESESLIAEHMRQINQAGAARFEVTHYCKDRSVLPMEVFAKAIEWHGEPALLSIATDITERKRAEERLRLQSLVLDQIADRVTVTDLDGVITYVNDAEVRTLGYEREDLIGASVERYGEDPDRGASQHEIVEDTLCQGQWRGEVVNRTADGREVILDCRTQVILDERGNKVALCGIATDITERVLAEEALRESEEKYRSLFNQFMGGIYLHDLEGRILDVNMMACAQSGYSRDELLKLTVFDLHPDEAETGYWPKDELVRAWKLWRPGQRIVVEGERRRKDGVVFPVEVSTGMVRYGQSDLILAIVQDISERKRAEAEREQLREQLNQAQKMESVGRLAGGVAHDFNNMLNVILGHAELAVEELPPEHPVRDDIEEIRKAAQRSADLTRQLLAYARKQTVAPRVLDLNETVASTLRMLRRLIGEDIQLTWNPSEALDPVRIDPAQVDQLLANLCVNARDAIGHNTGTIAIETGSAVFDEEYCAAHPGATAGRYVMLAVNDDGCGMDEGTRAQAFEPFFTTKGQGEGTGLGLATVYGIVKQNRGFVDICSELGQGTAVKVYLPCHKDRVAQDAEVTESATPPRGNETILLVEDEPAILKMTRTMLLRQGYAVLAAATPGEAIRLAQEHAGDIHLIITDVVMPEMNGRDLAKNVLSLYPRIKRLFMSGYTADVIAHQGVLEEGVYFIQKPFLQKDFTAKIRDVLGS